MPATNPAARFAEILDAAMRQRVAYTSTLESALLCGVSPQALIDYARGNLDPATRSEAETMLLQSEWAMQRVLALVRSARDPSSLGAGILRTPGRTNPYEWGMSETEDPEMDLARLLERIE